MAKRFQLGSRRTVPSPQHPPFCQPAAQCLKISLMKECRFPPLKVLRSTFLESAWYWVPFDLQTKTANRTARFVHIPSFPLMLKAFRQFSWIKGSRAYVIWTLRDIGKGESITLRYRDEKEGSYFSDNSPCSCETCTGRSVKLTPRSPTVSGPARSGKRTRRSGAREKAKRKAKLAELELAEGFGGEPDRGT